MRALVPLSAIAALALAATATAASYPPPSDPGTVQSKPKGPFHTLLVCEKNRGHGCYPRIQDAINAARPGDTIKVPHGVYKEGLKIKGASKRFIKLIGDPRHPGKVILEGRSLKGTAKANGVIINGANEVTVRGFQAQHYNGNGFFAVNVRGYHLNDLVAKYVGVYGLYAFNSIGGEMRRDLAAWNNDSGFYIGQTPVQTKPVRSMVSDVVSYGNVLGFSGTNMRYVTITKSKWFNNGVGIVPNALDSEKFPPPEDNVITGNDIFWNNFDYYAGAPFKLGKPATGEIPYPVGIGVLLFGGRHNRITGNRIFGNWLVGAGMIQQFLLHNAARDGTLIGNEITGNQFGLSGTDLNGRDIAFAGNGSDNCVSGNTGVQVTVPADASTFAPCPFSGANAVNQDAFNEALGWATASDHEAGWIRHPHSTQGPITPMEHYSPSAYGT